MTKKDFILIAECLCETRPKLGLPGYSTWQNVKDKLMVALEVAEPDFDLREFIRATQGRRHDH